MDNAIESTLESFQSRRFPAHRARSLGVINPLSARIMRLKLFRLLVAVAFFLSAGPNRVLAASGRYGPPRTPDFSIMANDGQTYSPDSLKGNVVLLYFWATWCPYCRRAVPYMNDLANEYANASFTIIGICGSKDTDSWHTYIEDHRIYRPSTST